MIGLLNFGNRIFDSLRIFDFLGPLALRLFLAPIMISAGMTKFASFESTVAWFGNPDWGLGLPFPEIMVYLAAGTELFGGIALIIGLAVRWVSIPLMVTMLVAIFAVHIDKGWFAIAPSNPETSMANVLLSAGIPQAQESLDNSEEVGKRLNKAKEILRENGNYSWLTEKGSFVVLNNGIEFAVTYFIMLLVLFFIGAGRFLSLDYWLAKAFPRD